MTGTVLTYASWQVTHTADDLPTNNFESYNAAAANSFDEGILGFIGATITCAGDWDAGTNPYDAPPGFYPRDDLATVLFYTSRLDVISWTFPYLRVRGSTNGADAKQKVAFSVNASSQGPFTDPAGSV